MKATKHTVALFGLLFCLAVGTFSVFPSNAYAQGMPSWWGSDRIWDWSDFRMNLGFRIFMPNLRSGTVSAGNSSFDMLGAGNFSFQPQPDYFKEGWFILYIDRLALRAHFEEDHHFRGYVGTGSIALESLPVYRRWWKGDPPVWPDQPPPDSWGFRPSDIRVDDPQRSSDLDVSWTRFGIDLDIVRYPFLRAGINFDRHFESVIFINRQDVKALLARAGQVYVPFVNDALWWVYNSVSFDGRALKLTTKQPPVTIGVHAFASPGRIRGIPVVAQARFRMPAPLLTNLLQDNAETRIIDWEVHVGLRPTIWNTSLYSMNTFAMGIDLGFRSSYLDMTSGDGAWQVKAHWQGPFVQVGLYY